MDIYLDCETQGLDATKFIMGCIIRDDRKKPKIYHKKNEMWQDIIKLGNQCAKQKKVLNIYAHNHQYDFYAYANLKDKNIKIYSQTPFIASYSIKGKEAIKYLDSYAIYRMPLKKVGEIINLKKLETPKTLLGKTHKIFQQQEITYMIRDTQIVQKAIQKIKQMLKQENINIRRLYTINQIAIQYILTQLKKTPKEQHQHLLWDTKKNEMRRTFHAKKIHSAYRGGRVECFKTGEYQKATEIDCINAYGWSITNMKIPDLSTERITRKPTKLSNKTGITRALIKNETNKLKLLPIRTPNGNYYPKTQQYAIGTWTNKELKQATKEGYKIITIEWTINYKNGHNPFNKIYKQLYKKRTEANDEFDKYFYKAIMNSGIGKFAQKKTQQEICIDSVEKVQEYLNKNYAIIKGLDYNLMYIKEKKETKKKPYYCPIIPTLVNAEARLMMYKNFKKFKRKNLLYTDTDSIVFKGELPKQIKIGTEIGQFKIEKNTDNTPNTKVPCKIYGRKTYSIGQKVKLSGISKRDIKIEDFNKGTITTKKMNTISTTTKIEDCGKFTTTTRNLNQQHENHKYNTKELEEQKILMDSEITEINHFIPYINEILKYNQH